MRGHCQALHAHPENDSDHIMKWDVVLAQATEEEFLDVSYFVVEVDIAEMVGIVVRVVPDHSLLLEVAVEHSSVVDLVELVVKLIALVTWVEEEAVCLYLCSL